MKKLLSYFFSKQIDELANIKAKSLKTAAMIEFELDVVKRKNASMQYRIGEPVIAISNSWDTPTIGFIVGVENFGRDDQEAFFIVRDYIKNEDVLSFGVLYCFDADLLHLLSTLNPAERWLLACRYGGDVNVDGIDVENDETMSDKVLQKLEDNGFWTKYHQWVNETSRGD